MSTRAEVRNLRPNWTVVYNILSKEAGDFIGSGWEFFFKEEDAQRCYDRQIANGNSPTMRPYHHATDAAHLHHLSFVTPLREVA